MSSVTQDSPSSQVECQFSGDPCSAGSAHFRKVISHIFGRNKKCTIGIPDYVWIYYCRKHYQRARYRTNEWPFRQCDLVMDTVRNMRAWGGVESFDLRLRRRESKRASVGEGGLPETAQLDGIHVDSSNPAPSSPSSPTVDVFNQTPLSSPFGSGLQTPITPVSQIAQGSANVNNSVDTEIEAPTLGDTETSRKKKKPPTIVPRPAPEWLHARVGPNKSFNEVLQILRELRADMTRMAENDVTPHFPDIEILPNLLPGAAVEKPKKASRINGNGAIQRPTPCD